MNDLNDTTAITRTADVIALEIKALATQYKAITLTYAVEFGRKLCEAKELVDHGAWKNWLKKNTEFSQSTAENLMNIFENYGSDQISFFGQLKSQAFGNLTVTKALALLKVPEDEREDFAQENDVDNLSTRQLEQLIKEKQAAEDKTAQAVQDMEEAQEREKKAQDAQAAAETKAQKAADDLKAEKKKADDAAAEVKGLKEQLAALKAKPADVPDEDDEADDTDAESIHKEASEAAERKLQDQITASEKKALEAEERARELERQLAVADPAVAKFAALYAEVQGMLAKLVGLIGEAAPEKQDGLRKALTAALTKYGEMAKAEGAA